MLKYFITIIFSFAFYLTSNAQQLLLPEQLLSDLTLIKKSLLSYHPDLFAYQDKAEFKRSFEQVANSLDKSMTENEFYILVKPLISNIKCSHTELYHSANYLSQKVNYDFPIEIDIHSNRIFVVQSVSPQIPAGSEILSMDGMESSLILQTLKKYICSDGIHNSGRAYWLQQNFFSLYTEILAKEITIPITIDAKGNRHLVTLMPKKQKVNAPWPTDLVNSYFEKKEGEMHAVLSIKTFDEALLRKSGINFNRFIKDFFFKVKQSEVDKLTIDLTDNMGGNDLLAIKLYSYISTQPFRFYESLQMHAKSKMFLSFPYNLFFKTEKSDSTNMVNYTGHKGLKYIKPAKNSYNGHLQLLINGGTMSAAAHFAAKCHNTERVKISGSKSAGTYQSSNSGFLVYKKLPNSKLQLFIPAIHYQLYLPNTQRISAAIEPDPNTDPLEISQ